MDEAAWQTLCSQWTLRPGVSYLNHGSFGPSPRVVTAARRELIERLESEPMDFLTRELDGLAADTRRRLGQFIGAGGDDLVLIENATVGMNIVAASVRLSPGDQVLANDHEYGAVLRIWERACRRARAELVVRHVPVPLSSPDEVVAALLEGAGPRTRLLVFSHVTSPTAIIFPAQAICRRARELGIPVCIDGPHALAMLDVNVASLDCDYYTASCHKWLCAPFGSGFLYVHPRVQSGIEPVVTSWGRTPEGQTASWRDEFHWSGTRDPSAWLAVPAAISFLESVGLQNFRQRTHELARWARVWLCERTGLEPLVPDSPDWYGSMIALPLPAGDAPPLQRALWEEHRIEVPIIDWQGLRLVRPSCHLYTQTEEIDRLVEALTALVPLAGSSA